MLVSSAVRETYLDVKVWLNERRKDVRCAALRMDMQRWVRRLKEALPIAEKAEGQKPTTNSAYMQAMKFVKEFATVDKCICATTIRADCVYCRAKAIVAIANT